MNKIADKLRKSLQAFNEGRLTVRANTKRKNESLFARIGINQTTGSGSTNKKRIILHSIIAFALFAGICYWLIATYFEEGRKPFYGAILLPWLASIGYLVVVYCLRKKSQ